MIKLQAGISENPKWVIRHYREITEAVKAIEKRRPSLLYSLRYDKSTGLPLPMEEQIVIEVDRPVVTAYVEGRMAIDIMQVVLAERLKERDRKIISDICLNGLKVMDAALKYGVSEKTVKRARGRMKEAYIDELHSRQTCEESVSSSK